MNAEAHTNRGGESPSRRYASRPATTTALRVMAEQTADRAVGAASSRTVGSHYRLWVNQDRTILFRLWDNGQAEVATRDHSSHTWGPPVRMTEEQV